MQNKRTSNSPSPSLSGHNAARNSLDGMTSRTTFDTGKTNTLMILAPTISLFIILGGVQEITDIPDDYLNQSHVLKHLAKEVKAPTGSNVRDSGASIGPDDKSLTRKDNDYPKPPPDYPKWPNRGTPRSSARKLALSRSQPDLSCCDNSKNPRPKTRGREDIDNSELWPSAEMVEILIKENSALKLEVENCYQRIAKTQKVINF